jgi:hypothetical protein
VADGVNFLLQVRLDVAPIEGFTGGTLDNIANVTATDLAANCVVNWLVGVHLAISQSRFAQVALISVMPVLSGGAAKLPLSRMKTAEAITTIPTMKAQQTAIVVASAASSISTLASEL